MSQKPRASPSASWSLQDAKARLSELLRRVHSDGPQHVTVHGRAAAVLISPEEFRRLTAAPDGKALVECLQASPHREIDLAAQSQPMPVRDVSL